MDENKKSITLTGEDEPVILRTKIRECKRCGGKFVPTSKAQKYCQECRKAIFGNKDLSKEKRKRDMENAFKPVEAKPAEELEELAEAAVQPEPDVKIYERDPAEAGTKWMEKDAVYWDLIDMIQRRYGVHLIDAKEYLQAKVMIEGREFDGIYIRRSTWEGE